MKIPTQTTSVSALQLQESLAALLDLGQAAKFLEELKTLSDYYPNFRAGKQTIKKGDPQQRQVYAAEGLHSEWSKNGFSSFTELREFVEHVEGSSWYKKHVGEQKIQVTAGKGDKKEATGGLFFISIPPIFQRKMVVLHEIAHAIYWRPSSTAEDHGPNFCTLYIELVREFLGKAAALELKALFRKKGVRVARASAIKSMRLSTTAKSRYACLTPSNSERSNSMIDILKSTGVY